MFIGYVCLSCLPWPSVCFRESNRLKYRSGSGSRLFKNLGFGSGSVAPKFKGSGSSKTKFLRFRFGSDLLSPNFIDSGSVRVHRKKAVFTGSGSGSLQNLQFGQKLN